MKPTSKSFASRAARMDRWLGRALLAALVCIAAPVAKAQALSYACGAPVGALEVGVSSSITCVASGGTAPYSWAVVGGVLPTGWTLNPATGVVSGTPLGADAGAYSFTLQVTDSTLPVAATYTGAAQSGTIAAAVSVSCPAPASTLEVGVGYASTCTTSGGISPFTYSVVSGSLPSGLSQNSGTGSISGTFRSGATGAFSFKVQVADSASVSAQSTALAGTVVAAPSISCASTATNNLEVGAPYTTGTCSVSGGTGGYTWSITGGPQPAGLSLSAATGTSTTIAGTPSTAGAFLGYTLTVTDSASTPQIGSQAFSAGSVAATLSISCPAPSSTLEVGEGYSSTCTTTGGVSPFAYTVGTGALPTGISQNSSTGSVSGTLGAAAAFSFQVKVTDSASTTASAQSTALAGTVIAGPSYTCGAPSATLEVGVSSSITCTATGGTSPYTFAVTSGAIPSGWTLNTSTGVVIGTPLAAAAGAYSFTLRVTDSATPSGVAYTGTAQAGTIVAAPSITCAITATNNLEVGAAYTTGTCGVSGGTGTYTWGITGTQPAGLSLSAATGTSTTLAGSPTTAGAFGGFTLTVTDSASTPQTGSQAFSAGSVAATLSISCPAPSSTLEVGEGYSSTCTTTGGVSPFAYTVGTGALPTGISQNSSTGSVSGTLGAAAAFSFQVKVTDSASTTASAQSTALAGTVIAGPSYTCAAPVGTLEAGVPSSVTCTASGGTTPYTWSLASGAIPSGWSLNPSTGVVSGTPGAAAAGAYSFTLRVTDSATPAGVANTGTAQAGTIVAAPSITCAITATNNLEVGAAYTTGTCGVSGGTGTYTWGITGTQPAGLSLSAATGTSTTLAGSPTTAGAFGGFTLTVTDSATTPQTGSQAFSAGSVAAAVSIGCPMPATTLEVGEAFASTCTTSGGVSPFTYSVVSGTLPASLSQNSGSGSISGTFGAAAAGAMSFQVKVTDSASTSASAQSTALSGTVIAGPTFSCAAPVGTLEVGVSPSITCTASSGTGPYAWALASGTIPSGWSLNSSTGVVSGTLGAAAAGSYSFTLKITDSATSAGVVYTGTPLTGTIVAAPSFTCANTATNNLEVGAAYTTGTCSVSGGTAPYSWSITGTPPAGLTLGSATGTSSSIAGTPTTAGAFGGYSLTVTDGATAPQAHVLPFNPGSVAAALSASCTATGTAEVGVAYSVDCSATTGGVGPYTWTSVGTLPIGVGPTNSSNGSTAGTISATTAYSFQLRVTDSASTPQISTSATFSGTPLAAPSITCTPTTGPTGVGIPFTSSCRVTGGTSPYSWTIASGTLPAGLSTSASNLTFYTVFGTPSVNGAYSYTVQVADSATTIKTASQVFSGTIAAGLTMNCTPTTGPTEVGVAYTTTCTVSVPGSGTHNWTIVGTQPPGLSLSATTGLTVTYSGTPTTAGPYTYTIKVTDSGVTQQTATQAFVASVAAAPTVSCLPTSGPTEQSVYYATTCTVSGGTGPYSWSVVGGTLPGGLSIGATGTSTQVSGAPSGTGAYSYRIQVTDSASPAQTAQSSLFAGTIYAPATFTCTTTTGPVEVAVAYTTTCTVTASSGQSPYTWSIVGALPSGVTAVASSVPASPVTNNTYTVSGPPATAAAGSYSYTVQLADSAVPAVVSLKGFSGSVAAAPAVTCSPAAAPTQVGLPYSSTCTVAGGTPPYTWSAVPTAAVGLADGTSLTASGGTNPSASVSGTPTTPETFGYKIHVVDTNSQTADSSTFSGTILPAVTLSCVLNSGPTEVSVSYSTTCTASGGTTPYTWSITNGSLPAGVTSAVSSVPAAPVTSNTFTISGTPTTAGAFSFYVKVQDSASTPSSQSQAVSGSIVALPTITCNPTAGPTQVGLAYSSTCSVAGGTTPYTWSAVATGVFPTVGLADGTSLTASGGNNLSAVVSGAPTTPENYSYKIHVVDGASQATDSGIFSGTVAAVVTFTCTVNSGPTEVSVAYSTVCTATGGTTPYTWTVANGSLPTGLGTILSSVPGPAITNNTFTITGPPTVGGIGPYAYTIKVSDSATIPSTITRSFAGTVAAVPSVTCNPTTGPVQVGLSYSATCTVSGGTQPYTWTSDALPAGLTLTPAGGINPSATVAGVPTAAVAYNYQVHVVDSAVDSTGAGATKTANSGSFSGTILAVPTFTCTVTAGPTEVSVAYSTICTATGGTTPYTWSIPTGSLPTGLSTATSSVPASPVTGNTFTITGPSTPAGIGAFAYTVKVTDSAPVTQAVAYETFSGDVVALPTMTCTTPTGQTSGPIQVGLPYNSSCTVSGGTPPYTWTTDPLPAGLALTPSGGNNPSATVSGVPTSPVASYSFAVHVTDSARNSAGVLTAQSVASGTFSGNIVAPVNFTCTVNSAPTEVSVAYSTVCTATGGQASYTWTIPTGSLPAGVTSAVSSVPVAPATSNTFTISGTPTAAGALSYIVKVTDSAPSAPASATQGFAGTVVAVPTVSCNLAVGPVQVAVSYTATCAVSGGTPPYTWTPVATASLPTVGLADGTSLTSSGGSNPSATVSGSPTTVEAYSYKLHVVDSAVDSGSNPAHQSADSPVFAGSILAKPAFNCTVTAGPTEVSVGYSTVCTATAGNGTSPYTWTIPTGALPAGLTTTPALPATGSTLTISGSPTAGGTGTYLYYVQLTDSLGQVSTRAFSGNVVAVPTVTCSPTTGPIQVALAYSSTCIVSGGTPPFAWTTDALPAGLAATLPGGNNSSITIAGVPTTAGAYSYKAHVTDSALDSAGIAAPKSADSGSFAGTVLQVPSFTCTVNAGPTEISVTYSTICTVSGGTAGAAGYTWTIPIGALPAGLTSAVSTTTLLNDTFRIAGAPTAAGAFAYTVKVTDNAPVTPAVAFQAFSGTVVAVPSVTCTVPVGQTSGPTQVGLPYSSTCTVAGGTAPYTWTLLSGSVPAGLSPTPALPATGPSVTVSGAPTTAGAFSYVLQVTDSAKNSAGVSAPLSAPSSTYSGTIVVPVNFTCTPNVVPTEVNVAYSTVCTATGGTAPYTWTIPAGSLPAGVTTTPALPVTGGTLTISGTPTASGRVLLHGHRHG